MSGIFINYRTADSAFGAVLLDNKLVDHFGEDAVFRDNRSLELGKTFEPALWERLRNSDVVLVVIGPHWLSTDADGTRRIDDPDDFVHREIVEALRCGRNLIPVLIGDTPMPQADVLPPPIRPLAGYPCVPVRARDPEPDIDRLVHRLRKLLGFKTQPAPKASAEGSAASRPIQTVRTSIKTVHGENIVFGFQNHG